MAVQSIDPFEKMSEKEKIRFLYIDLESRNLADRATIQKDLENDLSQIEETQITSEEQDPTEENKIAPSPKLPTL